MKFKASALLTIALIFVVSTFSASAQEETSSKSLGFTPVSQELHINPGDTYTDKVVVWHEAQEEMEYFIQIRGFKQIEDHPGTAVLLSEEQDMASESSASSWFHIETESVVVPPQHNFELNYLVEVPEDAAPGEYYAQIFFYTDEQHTEAADSVMTYSNLAGGPTFLVKTGDDFTESLDLLEFKSSHKFYETPEITLSTNVHNTGNVHLKPNGTIVLTNMFGQEIGNIEFNPDNKTLIRDSLATYITQWNSNYLLTDEGKLAIGPITAELTIYYTSESPGYTPITEETSFWIFQWKLALAILGAVIIIVWAVKASKKTKEKKNVVDVSENKEPMKDMKEEKPKDEKSKM